MILRDNFPYFFIKTYLVGAHPQHRFYEDLTKIIFQLLSNIIKYEGRLISSRNSPLINSFLYQIT